VIDEHIAVVRRAIDKDVPAFVGLIGELDIPAIVPRRRM
jgi:hypothetical protein